MHLALGDVHTSRALIEALKVDFALLMQNVASKLESKVSVKLFTGLIVTPASPKLASFCVTTFTALR
jgi:hypothetical protein